MLVTRFVKGQAKYLIQHALFRMTWNVNGRGRTLASWQYAVGRTAQKRSNREYWARPGRKGLHSKLLRKVYEDDPTLRTRVGAASRRSQKKPEVKAKHRAGLLCRWQKPSDHENQSKALIRSWQNPERLL